MGFNSIWKGLKWLYDIFTEQLRGEELYLYFFYRQNVWENGNLKSECHWESRKIKQSVCHNKTTNKQKSSTGSNINVLIICEKMISDKAFLGYAFVESSQDLFLTSKKIAPSHSRTCEVYTLLTRKQHLSFSSVTKVLWGYF